MKPWYILFLFFPLWSAQIDIHLPCHKEILDMIKNEHDEMYDLLDKRLDVIIQTLIVVDPYLHDTGSREVKKEYKKLKKEFYAICKTLLKMRGKEWKRK